jgi:hypothetical protein
MHPKDVDRQSLRANLGTMSDRELWRLFLRRGASCSREFWHEIENRKAAGILSPYSPFWQLGKVAECQPPLPAVSNVIEISREEWEARKRRKMFRLLMA